MCKLQGTDTLWHVPRAHVGDVPWLGTVEGGEAGQLCVLFGGRSRNGTISVII